MILTFRGTNLVIKAEITSIYYPLDQNTAPFDNTSHRINREFCSKTILKSKQ